MDAGGGGARAAAERARQALLLTTRALGVTAAEVRRARADCQLARGDRAWAMSLTRLYRTYPWRARRNAAHGEYAWASREQSETAHCDASAASAASERHAVLLATRALSTNARAVRALGEELDATREAGDAALDELVEEIGADQLLVNAASHGKEHALRYALARGANTGTEVNLAYPTHAYETDGRGPLHLAAKGHPGCLSLLLEAGADMDKSDRRGQTPVHHAVTSCGHDEVTCLRLLLEAGADMHKTDRSGYAPVHCAALHSRVGCLGLLLKAGAHKDAADPRGETPMHLAASHDSTDSLRLLLEAGADKDKTDPDGNAPLHAAARGRDYGGTDCVRLLLEAGDDKDKRGDDGRTPLQVAARHSNDDCVRLLLELGADKDKADHTGSTALHLAADASRNDTHWSGRPARCMELLLDAGADKEKADNNGYTPLHRAAQRGCVGVFGLLLERGADTHARTKAGMTALDLAMRGQEKSLPKQQKVFMLSEFYDAP